MGSLFAYRSPLHEQPPQPGQGSGVRSTRRLVLVLVDALRLDTSLDPQVMPYLDELRQLGASAAMHSRPPSYSQPGYATLLVGAWPDLHDAPVMNVEYAEIPAFSQDNLFSAAQRAGLQTAIAGYDWFEKLVPQQAVSAAYYTSGDDQKADEAVVQAALSWLETDAYPFIFIHLDQVDYAGHHEGGPRDPRWNQAARRVDDLIRQIGSRLDFVQDTLLVVSDHGQIDGGGHGGDEAVVLTEPFVLAGAGVLPGKYADVQMVDVAPTVAALLGVNLPAASQGRALTEMLDLTVEQLEVLEALTAAQQARLLAAYGQGIGEVIEAPDQLSVAAWQQALEAARMRRLWRERWPRLGIALGVVLVLAILLIWRRKYISSWTPGCALLYGLVFHLRYAILDGKTYSMSWVSSQQQLFSYLGSTTFLAFGISGVVFLLGRRLLRLPAGAAAGEVLGWTLATISLLALPALYSFVVNGPWATWTLPEMRSYYLAFLHLLQIPAVSLLGLTLAGVSALVAWLLRYRAEVVAKG